MREFTPAQIHAIAERVYKVDGMCNCAKAFSDDCHFLGCSAAQQMTIATLAKMLDQRGGADAATKT